MVGGLVDRWVNGWWSVIGGSVVGGFNKTPYSLDTGRDDDDDNDKLIFDFVVWLTDERRIALFPKRTIVRDPHHRESLTRREQDLNLRRTWVQAFLNEVITTTPWRNIATFNVNTAPDVAHSATCNLNVLAMYVQVRSCVQRVVYYFTKAELPEILYGLSF